MGKATKSSKSEIDDIFSGSLKNAETSCKEWTNNETVHTKKKRNKPKKGITDKSAKIGNIENREEVEVAARQSKVIVVDATTTKNKSKKDESAKVNLMQHKRKRNNYPNDKHSDSNFADTRGVKMKNRRTEDGYTIMKEDDLKLGVTGGDTENCPFDCNCCF